MARLRTIPRSMIAIAMVIALAATGFAVLWNGSGGQLPWDSDGYRVSFSTDDVKNLAPAGDVRMAGVLVGRVASLENVDGRARVVLDLDEEVAPLHDEASVRIGLKSVIGQQYVEVVDGGDKEIPDGATLPAEAVIPAVDVDELLGTFDEPTREALAGMLTSLDPATRGTREDVDRMLSGLGDLGTGGYTALDAISAQSRDIKQITHDLAILLAALDNGRADLAGLVTSASEITDATSAQAPALEQTIQRLPGLLEAARPALASAEGLGTDLRPFARDLEAAATPLAGSLEALPPATRELRELVGPVDGVLDKAPKTLRKVPATAVALSDLLVQIDSVLRDANPVLAYMRPYRKDIGAFFGNFAAAIDREVENGIQPVQLAVMVNAYSVRGNPVPLEGVAPLVWTNPYPEPGAAATTDETFAGDYPRVEREKP